MRRSMISIAASSVAAFGLASLPASADLVEPNHDRIVSANPENFTPNVENGKVESMVQVGNRIIAAGTFTSVTPTGGATVTRDKIFAFNATTGALDNTFTPNVGAKEVAEVVDAGDGTVYIGGAFTSVNGTATPGRVARIDANTGALVTSFKAPKVNGNVNDMQLINNKLYVGGSFTTMGGQSRTLLAALNPSTGADTGSVSVAFSGLHNGGANTLKHFDISNDGGTLVAVGNWNQVDGQSRPQIVMLDTSGANATVSGWATQRFDAQCASVFDTYMRDVDIAPSGRYFVAVSTGAYNAGTLCDAASRFAIGPNTGGQEPEWVDYSGGDTFTQVKITGPAIYVGGHFRWMNNPFAGDVAGPGAVPRTGLAALDPRNGLPFTWNPTRARGVGVWEFLPTTAGLWIGHDTKQLGHETRKRVAFMPLTGGTTVPADNTGSLPGDVYLVGQSGAAANNGYWVARVDAGGPALLSKDNGPDWDADRGDQTSPYHNDGSSNDADWGDLPFGRTANVPDSTPQAIFSTERWSYTDNPQLHWNFPAKSGDTLKVRLYFANGCSCTENPGQRSFDVSIDGTKVLDNYDIVADVGDQTGTMKEYTIPSDGNVDIDFNHRVENPLINGIEIIDTDVTAPGAGTDTTATRRTFDGSQVTSTGTVNGPDWSSTRGATMIDGKLFTGNTDGTLQVRNFNGTTFGTASTVNLYGLTQFANEIPNITGMTFDKADGRLYYTLAGQSGLYYRYFEPQSQVVGAVRFDAADNSGVDWRNASGMFLAGGKLYYGSRSTGNLMSVNWNGGPSGAPSVADSSSTWQARGMFLYAS